MSLSSQTQVTDEQFLTEILPLLEADEESWKEPTPRLRNKGKIELLRHEVKGLEAVLASLQNSSRGAAILERRRAGSLWRIVAMKQSHERHLAEQRNMGLKRMFIEQYSFTRSLTHVLDESTNLPATDLRLSACI
ncbi:hypothetical protein JG688_00010784 [Phytophthora aleatoria]|uniref:Uncharacterized protein n=1 Tax=Phytophthora aleatoria TaxID=2496075 RepID=A0A8J5M5Q8_9STRA|nr:hypothetical protein JG688_00010784 [Phytophthora aleatoria]